MLAMRKQNLLQQQIQQQAQQRAMQANMNVKQEPGSNAPSPTKIEGHTGGVPDGNQAMASTGQQTKPNLAQGEVVPKSYDSVEEVAQILRTAFPLLIMTMETMVAQLHEKFNTTPDEECYRLICMLLQDAYGVSPLFCLPTMHVTYVDFSTMRNVSPFRKTTTSFTQVVCQR